MVESGKFDRIRNTDVIGDLLDPHGNKMKSDHVIKTDMEKQK